MTRCPRCERPLDESTDRCPHCDAEVAVAVATAPDAERGRAEQTCAACGAGFDEGESCPECGMLRVSDVRCETHPEQEAEHRCVICARALCPRCRSGENRALCEEHRAVPIVEGWAQVYSTSGEFEAQLLRENLQAEGIDAQVFSQRDHAFSLDVGELSIVRVLVPVHEFQAALGLIRERMDSEGEVSFACPECGEAYEPGEAECTSCGAALA